MKAKPTWVLFALVAAAQLAVPAWHIAKFEWVLRRGTAYRFRCRPVDPFDAFRGRYVRISPDIGTVPWHGEALLTGASLYVALRTGADGFAEAVEATRVPPKNADYIEAYCRPWGSDTVAVDLPFDRYYMPENLAPLAERAYGQHVAASNTWVSVRVKNGAAVIENLYLDGRPISEVAREMIEKR